MSTVSHTLDRLMDQGKVVERKHRKIRIRMPDNSNGNRLDFQGVDFSGRDLRGANLRGAILHGVNFEKADLHGANLRDAKLANTNFKDANLEGVNLRKAHAYWADFSGANLVDVDAIGTKMTRTNLTGANVKRLKVGSPLTQHSLWDHVQLEPHQIHDMEGIAYTHYIMAIVFFESLKSDPLAPFVSGLIESERFGCWGEYLCHVALNFPELFVRWIDAWRDPVHDPTMRVWMEFNLMRALKNLEGQADASIWSEISRLEMPRIWSIFFRWQSKSANEASCGLDTMVAEDEAELFGVLDETNWQSPTNPRPIDSQRALRPTFVSESDNPVRDVKKIVKSFRRIQPLSSEKLVQMINKEFAEDATSGDVIPYKRAKEVSSEDRCSGIAKKEAHRQA